MSKTQAIQGTVIQMNTLKGSQFVKIERKDGSVFVAEFPEGEHRSFSEGPLPKPIFGMRKQEEQFKTKDGMVDHYVFVGEGASTSDRVYAPTDPQSDVTKDIPAAIPADSISEDTIGKMAAAAANLLAFSPISNQIENLDEMGDTIEGMTLRMFSIVANVKRKLGK